MEKSNDHTDLVAEQLSNALVERSESRFKTIAFVHRHEIIAALQARSAASPPAETCATCGNPNRNHYEHLAPFTEGYHEFSATPPPASNEVEQAVKDCPNCDMPLGRDGGCYYPYCDAPQKPTTPPSNDHTDLIAHLSGPHEWGYRDPVVGGFIADDTPFKAADVLALQAHLTQPASNDQYRLMLLDLLAVIHRDGGHKTQELGIKLSWEQALRLSSERISSQKSSNEDAELIAKLRARVAGLDQMEVQPGDPLYELVAEIRQAADALQALSVASPRELRFEKALREIAGFDYEHDDMEMQIVCADLARTTLDHLRGEE